MTPLLFCTLVMLNAPEERFDHHGAVGLLLAASGEHSDANVASESGWRGSFNVGGTLSIGWASSELMLSLRGTLGENHLADNRLHELGLEVYGGYRGYFGPDRFKTLFDLNAVVNFTPYLVAGPRIALGAQYELSSTVGIFAMLGAQLGFGELLQFRAELVIGVQLRSYLLE